MSWQFHHYEQLSSTMDQALNILADPQLYDTERYAITATVQTKGRGRHQRHWISSAGNIHLTLLFKPLKTPYFWPQLSFVTSIAVYDWIQRQLQDNDRQDLSLKWPNDVLLNDKKIAGILLEIHNDVHGQPWMIIGIGINVVSSPQDLLYATTHIQAHTPLHNETAVTILCANFDEIYKQWFTHDFTMINHHWLKRSLYSHRLVNIDTGKYRHQGQCIGINDQGHILLNIKGSTQAFAAGDVTLQ